MINNFDLLDPHFFDDEDSWTDEEKAMVEKAMADFMQQVSESYFKEIDPDCSKYNAAMEYAKDAGFDVTDSEQIFALTEEIKARLKALETQIDHDIAVGNEKESLLHRQMYTDLFEIAMGVTGIMVGGPEKN